MTAVIQAESAIQLSEAEKLYLEVFRTVDNEPKRILSRHFMNVAMATIHGWEKKYTEDVCLSLIEKSKLFPYSKRRIAQKPEPPKSKRRGHCAYCRRLTSHLTTDHVVPRSKGGPDEEWNRVQACGQCNLSKANRDPNQWARDILNYRKPIKPIKPRTPIGLRLKVAASLLLSFFGGLLR